MKNNTIENMNTSVTHDTAHLREALDIIHGDNDFTAPNMNHFQALTDFYHDIYCFLLDHNQAMGKIVDNRVQYLARNKQATSSLNDSRLIVEAMKKIIEPNKP